MKPTMKDVAERAGVSKSTVSQFLNKRYSYMSEATRKKIEQAIADLGYYPNQIAKSLKQKQTHIIAFVCANLSSRFSLELVASIEKSFQEAHYSVIIASTDDDPQKEQALIKSFLARQVDGIIVFPTKENRDFYQQLQQSHFPLVFVDRVLADLEIPSVLLDNQLAGFKATQTLLSQRHQNIAIITFPLGDRITTRVERIEGYRSALSEAGQSIREANIVSCVLDRVEWQLTQLMQRSDAPTGLVVTNDVLLEATLMWVKKQHIRVPDELSLVGIDDIASARLFEPEITTLAQPVSEIGVKAANLLLAAIDGQPTAARVYRYEPKLTIRNSIKTL
ncbi:LacI family DNA-binding transcriptional regulator [Lactiplantibacillus mudanjiangensis]|uniref:HTH lacI-type domain-containing protein n=1 Tax=Lactiplantibacillus mudanjiangensis TaxID=1296538 RepID=A0A660E277_9LACO|nr:LacI family DNA-binding transcriptional regulator [Lactiplantibacillus mudanjiangensis]VDG22527.1 hypothetical protein [Lactobacillus casei] [Lactiplantibacillus mudanjiangensis]VDG26925.1 hypothetical protein [Lactobacillus casei] [Lactiplantibacillus mudanjiangensis]